MHYNIRNELIKSENAARSVKQSNKEIIQIINKLPANLVVLDYGCGKLRYTIPLSKIVNKVYSVDSQEQINKIQLINDVKTTVKEYSCIFMENVSIFSLNEVEWKNNKYDFILCCNVLSAIPTYKERIRIFENIKLLLNNTGRALISTQYRNSYFDLYNKRKECRKYYDGWIIKGNGSSAFYGLITLEKMINYAKSVGLNIEKAYKKDGSAYLIVNMI